MKIIADENIPFIEKACKTITDDIELIAGRAITPRMVKDADALLVRSITKVNAKLLDGSSIKFVGTATIGTDHIDIDYLKDKNIGFASAPGSNATSVAEYITAALLTIAHRKNIILKGKTIGIVGVGNVGSRVEKKALALGMTPVLNDPPLQEQTGNTQRYRPIEEIYDCDIITMHTPLTKTGPHATYHLCDDQFFKNIRPGCIFLNSSRGGVHQTSAIKSAVNSRAISSLVLDVWEDEPDIDVELLKMTDIATPHIAGYSYDGKIKGMVMIYQAMCEHLGLPIKSKTEDFLPAPVVPTIHVEAQGDDQQKIYQTVKRIYDIEADDHRCRGIIDTPVHERGQYFDKLRKTYPVRREFQNTAITGAHGDLAETFAKLGFQIE